MSTPLRVLLATSWNTRCGIAAHSEQVKTSVGLADPQIQIYPSAEALDPAAVAGMQQAAQYDLLHLNHHDALHSRWTAEHVRELRTKGLPVVVTYHDTREVAPPKLIALSSAANAIVVHEPVQGFLGPASLHYWRQGVPAPATCPIDYAHNYYGFWGTYDGDADDLSRGQRVRRSLPLWKAYPQQPVLGTVGFDFPWKNFDRLAAETRALDWALVIISPNATAERVAQWTAINPASLIIPDYPSTPTVVNYLAGCDATAFMYECANTGTSGAIRLGIAARKPVIALEGCRQFRDLQDTTGGGHVISALEWVTDWEEFRQQLTFTHPGRYAPLVNALAHRDSWRQLGRKYAALYRAVVTR